MSTSRLRLLAGLVLVALWAGVAPTASGAATTEVRFRPAVRAQSTPALDLSCESCLVVDDLGRTLWARSPRTQLPNASTTKMVTALVTVAHADPEDVAVVSSAAGSVGGGGLDLQAGDQMQVHDLLVAMLLSSSNEAAATLAEHVAGTQEAFVADMNRTARALGAERTHFANPHGLDATGHHSTAEDLAAIGRAVLGDPLLSEIVGTSSAAVQTPRGAVTEQNRNLLLDSYDGAIGIKTGRTLGAGNVLVAAAKRGDRTLIAVAMRSFDATADARTLLDAGFRIARRLDRPRTTTILAKGAVVGTMVFDPGGSVTAIAGRSITLDLPPGAPDPIVRFLPRARNGELEAGRYLGRVDVVVDNEVVAFSPVVVADDVPETPGDGLPNVLGTLISWVAGAVAVVT